MGILNAEDVDAVDVDAVDESVEDAEEAMDAGVVSEPSEQWKTPPPN